MVTEIKIPPMADHKADAGPDWFFCDGCLAYHPPEYQSRNKRYCKFAFSIVQDKESPVDDEKDWLDKPITDLLPASILQAWEIEDAALERLYSRKPTPRKKIKAKLPVKNKVKSTSRRVTSPEIENQLNVTRQQRSLRKELPEDEIVKSTESGEALAKRYGVTRMTISRIRRGQRVLV